MLLHWIAMAMTMARMAMVMATVMMTVAMMAMMMTMTMMAMDDDDDDDDDASDDDDEDDDGCRGTRGLCSTKFEGAAPCKTPWLYLVIPILLRLTSPLQ